MMTLKSARRLVLNNTGCPLEASNLESILPTAFNFLDEIWVFGVGTAIIGSINFIMSYVFVTCLNHAAESQVCKAFFFSKLSKTPRRKNSRYRSLPN